MISFPRHTRDISYCSCVDNFHEYLVCLAQFYLTKLLIHMWGGFTRPSAIHVRKQRKCPRVVHVYENVA